MALIPIPITAKDLGHLWLSYRNKEDCRKTIFNAFTYILVADTFIGIQAEKRTLSIGQQPFPEL